jgi:hypothetical protein
MVLHETEISKYYESLDEARQDGFAPVKATTVLCFYKLDGRKTTINKESLVPITYLQYLVFSPLENRYYLKSFRNYDVGTLFFYEDKDHVENVAIEQLRRYIYDGNVYLIFNKQQVADMSSMLCRVWKAVRSDEGKLGYKDWLTLVETSLKLEDYQYYGKNLTGFKTVCKMMQDSINDLWKNAKSNLR